MTDQPENTTEQTSEEIPQIENKKLYVGNVSFSSTNESLTKAFEAFGKVVEAIIVMRGNRSLGFGFVEMETVEECKKAIEGLHETELDGRQIVVEFSQQQKKPRQNYYRKYRQFDNFNYNYGLNYGTNYPTNYATNFAPNYALNYATTYIPNYDQTYLPNYAYQYNYGGQYFGGYNTRYNYNPNYRSHRQRKKIDESERTLSKTTLFVTNIPFVTTDEELKIAFTNYNPKSARVVVTKNGRSRGFGFVEFENEEDRDKALEINEKELGGRTIYAKVAFELNKKEEETEKEIEKEIKKETEKETEKEIKKETEKQTEKQTKKETEKEKEN
ncbi:nucleic acid binding protein [Anaeramoeba flamelloides]|uniref:Nucleic acid binding protein n=1 Tax=Anaeramoeba flamelloides TaxID=1746091 RepID=A0ABQ8YCD1_9EUKA|nr:nucleic acid binding protein [Anaeramoeba flamelloides]